MDKTELATMLAKRTGIRQSDADIILSELFHIMFEQIASGEKIKIRGFGSFGIKKRAPRTGRNPKANVPVPIPARYVPYFTPGKTLKSAINQ